jgi:hypothetical protein
VVSYCIVAVRWDMMAHFPVSEKEKKKIEKIRDADE